MTALKTHTVIASMALAGLTVAGTAHAQVKVSIRYDTEDRREAAERLLSELESEGYRVELETGAELSPCDPGGSALVTLQHGTKAWIRVAPSPTGDDTVVASVCYLGALPFLQQASSSAARSDPDALAVTTAEALNGLRARLPPLVAEPAAPRPRSDLARRIEPATPALPRLRLVNGIGLGPAVLLALPDHPPALGASLRMTLGVGASSALALDAFFPTTGAELRSLDVTATVRTAWLRLGPRLHLTTGDFLFAGAALAGAAVTWATAVARPPRVGTTDVATGALFSLSASAEYPRATPLYASASASMSVLWPGVRVKLGSDATAPRGAFPLEASMGLGARWGGR
jgi:hypothetical protein